MKIAKSRTWTTGEIEEAIAVIGKEPRIEEHVNERIIRRYVDRSAATKALIRQLNEKRT